MGKNKKKIFNLLNQNIIIRVFDGAVKLYLWLQFYRDKTYGNMQFLKPLND